MQYLTVWRLLPATRGPEQTAESVLLTQRTHTLTHGVSQKSSQYPEILKGKTSERVTVLIKEHGHTNTKKGGRALSSVNLGDKLKKRCETSTFIIYNSQTTK